MRQGASAYCAKWLLFPRLVGLPRQIAAAVHDHHNLDGIGAKPVNDAIALINHFADTEAVSFRHRSTAVWKLWQVTGGMQQAFNKGLGVSGRVLCDVIANMLNIPQSPP